MNVDVVEVVVEPTKTPASAPLVAPELGSDSGGINDTICVFNEVEVGVVLSGRVDDIELVVDTFVWVSEFDVEVSSSIPLFPPALTPSTAPLPASWDEAGVVVGVGISVGISSIKVGET
jgi:hypothetical protein